MKDRKRKTFRFDDDTQANFDFLYTHLKKVVYRRGHWSDATENEVMTHILSEYAKVVKQRLRDDVAL